MATMNECAIDEGRAVSIAQCAAAAGRSPTALALEERRLLCQWGSIASRALLLVLLRGDSAALRPGVQGVAWSLMAGHSFPRAPSALF
ncbi:unnamed protein product [Gongylonema pulchrum]|uniref:HTH psq-type domain-containing protein n=1 Tax=Gongylonema pulchrum TaxID=637853 RepID=A0A183E1Q7_9BILA|nr:unnamed protein product [Gongylonema pulchrum]